MVAGGVLLNMANDTGYAHRMVGYGCVIVIAIRLLHGFLLKTHQSSRFYYPCLHLIKQHVVEIRARKISHHEGHNPLGMLAVYVIWLLILLLAISGWLSRTDAFWGEDAPVFVHEVLSYLLLVCVFVHVIAVFMMSILQKKNLIKPMIVSTNSKRNQS